MSHHKSELYFLAALLIGVAILAFLIFKPFLYALVLAVVFATIFAPLHRKILTLMPGKRGLASLLAMLSVVVIVIVPIAFLAVQIFQEASQFYFFLASDKGVVALTNSTKNALYNLRQIIPLPAELTIDLNQYVKPGLNWIVAHLGSFASNAANAMIGTFIFLIALYYLFKDGEKLKKKVLANSLLDDAYDKLILDKLTLAINAVIRGNLVVAIVQGILSAIGFWIFGVPNAVLWGSLAAIASLIPGFGTALVIAPAILFLFLSGEMFSAIGMAVWGVVAVGLIDNFLGPKLVEQKVNIHPFLILLSILGGLSLFGPLGFLLGPLVLSLLFALLEIYSLIHKEHTE